MPSSDCGWTLPCFELNNHLFWQDVRLLNEAVRDRFGIFTTTLRCVFIRHDPQMRRVIYVYAMENHSPEVDLSVYGSWVDNVEVSKHRFPEPILDLAIREWVVWTNAEVRTLRAPWYEKGWLETAVDWIREHLSRHMRTNEIKVEQLRSWQLSSLMRAKTVDGNFYFKAVHPALSHEVTLTQLLAQLYPNNIATVISADIQRHWILMSDVGDCTLHKVQDVNLWKKTLRIFAEIQIGLSEHVSLLKNSGCQARGLNELTEELSRLLTDTGVNLVSERGGLTKTQAGKLRAKTDLVKSMVSELEILAIPLTLEHGDFWSPQVVLLNQEPIYLDWSHSSISHPFFSVAAFLLQIEDELSHTPEIRSVLREAYLECWTAFESLDHLNKAFDIVQPLAMLHYAMRYYQIVSASEIKWELKMWVPWYLRRALYYMDE